MKGWRAAPSPAWFILSDSLGCGRMSEAKIFSSVLSSEMGGIEPSWGVRWATREWYDDSGIRGRPEVRPRFVTVLDCSVCCSWSSHLPSRSLAPGGPKFPRQAGPGLEV